MISTFNNILSISVLFCCISCLLTYIDDTDETYGYWEPLHYLLYGTGMQTWEYSPVYAIRTYAFVIPFWSIVYTLKSFSLPKVVVFESLKFIIGIFSAFSHSTFLFTILNKLGVDIFQNNLLFSVFAFGIFNSSTSLLPSAVVANFVLLSLSFWVNNKFLIAILFGCVAVVWSGWPFVAVVFVPIGLHMIAFTFYSYGVSSVISLLLQGLVVLVTVTVPAAAIDFYFYGKRTFPPLNILLYNVLGGQGDELYGVEPASYYVKNLVLNLGPSILLAPALPLVVIASLLTGTRLCFVGHEGKVAAVYVSALAWLAVLFSRPHKEERFLYPVLPLMTFLAAVCLKSGCDLLSKVTVVFTTKKSPVGRSLSVALRIALLALAVCLGLSRSIACYRNYSGYRDLWRRTSDVLKADPRSATTPLTVCMGTHWYTFHSHFHLPENTTLAFVRDAFHGQLPQPYSPAGGTYSSPLQPFNDENKEEMSRYLTTENECTYAVVVIDNNRDTSGSTSGSDITNNSGISGDLSFSEKIVRSTQFELVERRNILNAKESPSLTRAFFIPYLSSRYNRNSYYALFKRTS